MNYADMLAEFADMRRRIQNLLRFGTIAACDYHARRPCNDHRLVAGGWRDF